MVRPRTLHVSVVVDVELRSDEFGARIVADRDEDACDAERAVLTGEGVVHAQAGNAVGRPAPR